MKQRTAIVVIGMVSLASGSLYSQDMRKSLAACAAVKSPLDRLGCFDKLTSQLGVDHPRAVPVVTAAGKGKWSVSATLSPIDDSKNVTLSLEANESVGARYRRVTPTLILRCKERKTDAYISWDAYLGLEQTTVLTRLDDRPASKSEWSLSTDNKATFAPQAKTFIKGLLGHSRLVSQVTPYSESPVLVTFDLAGLDAALKPLSDACHW